MPHPWKRVRNNMQHAHAQPQERDMVVLDPAKPIYALARDEEARKLLLCLRAVRPVHERPGVREPRLRGGHRVEQPRGVDEGGEDGGVRRPQEVEQDEVLDRAELGFGGGEQAALGVGGDVGCGPFVCEVSTRVSMLCGRDRGDIPCAVY